MPRTDNDTWDLATSVGATATMVAAARAIATRADHRLVNDPFPEPLVRAVGVDFFTRWASGELDGVDVDNTAGWGLHRMPDAMAARTAYFDAFFADARRRERANVFGGDPYVLDADGARRKDEFGADGC